MFFRRLLQTPQRCNITVEYRIISANTTNFAANFTLSNLTQASLHLNYVIPVAKSANDEIEPQHAIAPFTFCAGATSTMGDFMEPRRCRGTICHAHGC